MISKLVYLVLLYLSVLVQKQTVGTPPSDPSEEDVCLMQPAGSNSASSSSVRPISSDKYKNIGNDRYYKDDYQGAFNCYSRAIELISDEAKYYRNRGLSLEKLKMMEDAKVDHQKALELEPYNVRGRFNLGRLLLEMRMFDEAVEHLQKALDYGDPRYMMSDESQLIKTMLDEAHEKIEDALKAKQKAHEEELFHYLEKLIIDDAEYKIAQLGKHDSSRPNEDEKSEKEIVKIESDRDWYLKELKLTFSNDDLPLPASFSIPEYFCDKISYDIMKEPVITPSGITYEKALLLKHLANQHTDPLSRKEIRTDELRTNHALKAAIEDFMKKNRVTYRTINEMV